MADAERNLARMLAGEPVDNSEHPTAELFDRFVASRRAPVELVHKPSRSDDRDLPGRHTLQVAAKLGFGQGRFQDQRHRRGQLSIDELGSLAGPVQRTVQNPPDPAVLERPPNRSGLSLAQCAQVEAGQVAVHDAVRILHVGMAHQEDPRRAEEVQLVGPAHDIRMRWRQRGVAKSLVQPGRSVRLPGLSVYGCAPIWTRFLSGTFLNTLARSAGGRGLSHAPLTPRHYAGTLVRSEIRGLRSHMDETVQADSQSQMSQFGWLRRPMVRALLAGGLAIGAGVGTFAAAHAATPSPAASPAPSTGTTHNCPNM